MNLRQLEYFVAAAETLNFTKAAEKCFISQTAMSLQIQALEKNVGVPLFIRDKHHVELTPAGNVYLTEAKLILTRHEEALRLTRNVSEGATGSLTIGFARGYEQTSFPRVIRSFRKAYPNITSRFIRDNTTELYKALDSGTCDLIFTVSQLNHTPSDIEHRYLKNVPLIAALYPEHALAKRSMIRLSELKDEDFIIMQPKGSILNDSDEYFLCYNIGHFVPKIAGTEKEEEIILLMVSAGMGIALIPEYCVRNYRENQNLKLISVADDDEKPVLLDFEISWKSSNNNPALNTFLGWTTNLPE